MNQLPFFSATPCAVTETTGKYQLDADSDRLLSEFQISRLAQGAHPQSVRREVSQLRAMMRVAGTNGQPVALRALFGDQGLIARVLREPTVTIARSTGRARLLAAQRFIQLMGRALGRDAATDLATLDTLLPARRSTGWHTTGAVVAGTTGRRRRRGPTFNAADLRRIVDAAGTGRSGLAHRDRSLVALHCFSGLRAEEIVRLSWEDLTTELTVSGHYGLTASVDRNGRCLRLLLPGPASDAVETLAAATGGTVKSLYGPVLCAHGVPGCPLSYRAARDVLRDACRRTNLPPVESTALRAAFAHWLRSQGLSDHEVAAVLGLTRVRSVDRLLRQHAALDAQRVVRETLDR